MPQSGTQKRKSVSGYRASARPGPGARQLARLAAAIAPDISVGWRSLTGTAKADPRLVRGSGVCRGYGDVLCGALVLAAYTAP